MNRKLTLPAVACIAGLAISQTGFSATLASPGLVATGLITQAITMKVPGTNADLCGSTQLNTLQDALGCLSHYQIANTGMVTIEMTQSPTTPYQPVVIDHPNGNHIEIMGDCTAESADGICTIPFIQSGFIVSGGKTLKQLSNFKLVGQNKVYEQHNITGIGAFSGGSIAINNIDVSGFGWGVLATANGQIKATDVSTHNNLYGFDTEYSSFMQVHNVRATNNTYGFYVASNASMLIASGSNSATSNSSADFYLNRSSALYCLGESSLTVNTVYQGFASTSNNTVCGPKFKAHGAG